MPAVSFAALWVPGRRRAGGRGEGVHLPRVLADRGLVGGSPALQGTAGALRSLPPDQWGVPGRLTRLLRDAECRRGNAVCFFRPWAQLNSGGMTLPLVLPPAENHSSR